MIFKRIVDLDLIINLRYLELIVKLKGKELYDKKCDQKQFDKIPKNKICGSINLEFNIPSIDNILKNSKFSLVDKDYEILNNISIFKLIKNINIFLIK